MLILLIRPLFIWKQKKSNLLYFLTGITASGKSNLAHKIALENNMSILSVDSMAVYRGLDMLTAKPTDVMQAQVKYYGIDIAAKQGTMIKSSGAGIVTMAEDDLYYTGGTLIMDHGHGISTIYSHLENILVSVGDKINQGDVIGTVGSTGRSTGPHLDFRVNWFQTRLDPMSVLK